MANILDTLCLGIPIGILVAIYYGNKYYFGSGHPFTEYIVISLVSITLWIIWNGQTPGKKLMGIRIVSYPDYQPLSASQAWIRYLIGYTASTLILGFGFVMIAFREDKRGLHDLISGTCVIQIQDKKADLHQNSM